MILKTKLDRALFFSEFAFLVIKNEINNKISFYRLLCINANLLKELRSKISKYSVCQVEI